MLVGEGGITVPGDPAGVASFVLTKGGQLPWSCSRWALLLNGSHLSGHASGVLEAALDGHVIVPVRDDVEALDAKRGA